MDRKAWIVLVLCSALLAVNIYYQSKNREAFEKQRQEELDRRQAQPEADKPQDPKGPGDPSQPEAPAPDALPDTPVPEPVRAEEIVELSTDKTIFAFTTFGGGVKHTILRDQFAVGEEEEKVRLNRHSAHPVGRLTAGPDEYLDIVYEHQPKLKTERSVTFAGKTKDGLYVKKTWTLFDAEERGSEYRLKLEIAFENNGEKPVELGQYGLFAGTATPLWDGEWDRHIMLYYRKDGDYKKRRVSTFKKGKKPTYRADAGIMSYAGVSNQFFATLIAPEAPYDAWVWGNRNSVRLPEVAGGGLAESIRLGLSLPAETIETGGGRKAYAFEVFMGPKRNLMLRKTGEGRGEIMNYGMLGPISWVLNWLLNVLHVHVFDPISQKWSWGLAIVLLTIIIRAAMWPLQNKSTRAMKRMAKLQPQMAELKEKYPDDPQKVNQEMMKMYREFGINPLGGCLPLLVQIPIFFGFYTMLMYAVELRQQEFLWWVKDLSQPDTIARLPFALPFLGDGVNLLPILMAATMVLQMALTPKTGDKMQRRIFMLMPVIFFFFCYNFASALALYWTTSNIFAIGQMLITQRLPEPELKKRKKGAGFWEKMQARAEEAKKMQKADRARQMGMAPRKPKKRRPRTGG